MLSGVGARVGNGVGALAAGFSHLLPPLSADLTDLPQFQAKLYPASFTPLAQFFAPSMGVCQEAKLICQLAWPSCIANLTFLSSMAVMAYVGQYGTDALAGAGLGFMW